jgi:branched-chain amino acid transport system substrate-binding protein
MHSRLFYAALVAASVSVGSSGPVFAKDFKLGSVQSLTGIYSFVGVSLDKGMQLAAEQINASGMLGSGNHIVLDRQDPASDRTQTTTLMTRYGADPDVLLVFGPSSTIEALASAPAAQAAHLLNFTNGALPALLKSSDYLFRTLVPTLDSQAALANYAVDNLHVKNCAFVTVSDNEGYLSQRDALRDIVTKKGGTVVADETPKGSETDFAAMSTKIVFRAPDCIFLNMPAESMANVIIQLKTAGLSPDAKIFIDAGGSSVAFIKTGGKAVEGVYSVTPFFAPGATPMARQFSADFEKKYGAPPDNWAALGYMAMQVVANAIKAAGPDVNRESLRAAMIQTKDLPVVVGEGKVTIGADRETHYGLTVLTVKDAKWTIP